MSMRLFRILSALSVIIGVIMLVVSFNINPGPPLNATGAQLAAFARQYYTSILWGAWLQAVGPFLIVLFAFAVVFLSGAATRLAGWMTFFGGVLLMVVSLTEIVFYFGALFAVYHNNLAMGLISLDLIHATQHLYFIVAAPALFVPLGIVILYSHVALPRPDVLPRIFGYLAIALGVAFVILGIVFLNNLVLPLAVQAFAGVQALWWLAAGIIMIIQTARTPEFASEKIWVSAVLSSKSL